MKRRLKPSIIITAILCAVAIGGYATYASLNSNDQAAANIEPAAGPGAPSGPMPVITIQVKPQAVTVWKDYSGRLEPVEFADIQPQVSGMITDVRFEDGQTVTEGDILYVIDPRPFKAAANAAKADLQSARNRMDLAEKELTRAQDLIATKAISKRVLDERTNERDVAKASVESAKAHLETTQINLDYAYVKAPISGRVSRVEIKKGNLVEAGPNAPILTSIVSNDKIYAEFEMDESTYLKSVRSMARNKEQESTIAVEMNLPSDDQTYKGAIYSFDNQLDVASGTIRARALFDNHDGALLPGMFVTVKIASLDNGDKILVPERAIGTDQARRFVYVVDDNSMVTYREVQLGESSADQRIILSGLTSGDQVITEGVLRIRPGMPVQIQTEGAQNENPAANPANQNTQ